MPGVKKWKIYDPSDPNPATNTYTFEWSPNAMSSPFPRRSVTAQGTTAPGGQALVWEGPREPAMWTFEGSIPNRDQYEALRKWVLERTGRMVVTDHFGRDIVCVFRSFTPTPPERMKVGRYWYHTYSIEALVISVGAPTVPNGGPA